MWLKEEPILLGITSLITLISKQTLPLVLALQLRLDAQLHLLADDGVEDKGPIWRHRLPVLDPAGVDRARPFAECQHHDRDRVLRVVFLRLRNGRDARCPDFVLVHGRARDLPGEVFADAADLVEDGFPAGPWRDEDVVGEELDLALGHAWGEGDEGEELGGVGGGDEVAGIENGAFDLEAAGAGGNAGADGEVVRVDHTLDFGGFGDGVEVGDAFGHLDDFGCNGFAGSGCVGGEKHLVELFEKVSEAFDTVWR